MRTGLDGLASRYSMVDLLPALMQADDFTARLVSGLDEVLAPVLGALDSLDAYFDPYLTPDDFLAWLAGWVGATVEEDLEERQRRQLVAETAELYGRRGTMEGLSRWLELTSPVDVQSIVDSGGVSWSRDPTAAVDDASGPGHLIVTVSGDESAITDVQAFVAAWCPAHVPFEVRTAS